jgi:uncharacterized membrane protein
VADDEQQTPVTGATLGKARMEALSDAVLAIVITLLVLNLALRPPGSPWDQFLRAWPSYLVYVVSFLTIGGAWIAHNGLTEDLDHVDRIFLRLNILFLLTISFLPFPTRLVGDALEKSESWQRMAVTVFGLTVLATRLMFEALAAYSRREHLRRPGVPDTDLQDAQRKFRLTAIVNVGAIALGLAFPIAAIVLYFALAVFFVVPFRAVANKTFRRRREEHHHE